MAKRYLVEFGVGVDMHGGNSTKAAARAVRDAVSHCCMCGISEILGDGHQMPAVSLQVKLAVPKPETVDVRAVLSELPGDPERMAVELVQGGLSVRGLHVESLGAGDEIIVANAAIIVFVDL